MRRPWPRSHAVADLGGARQRHQGQSRQTDRQRQADIQTNRRADREREREASQRDREAERERERDRKSARVGDDKSKKKRAGIASTSCVFLQVWGLASYGVGLCRIVAR